MVLCFSRRPRVCFFGSSTGVLAGVEVEIPISLNQVVRDLIKKDMGSSSKAILREKYEQLCHSCLPGVGHGGHARIAARSQKLNGALAAVFGALSAGSE